MSAKKPTYEDLTERVATLRSSLEESEAARRQAEEILIATLDALPNAIFTFDGDAVIESWNARCREVYGFGESEAVGGTIYDTICRAEDVEATRETIRRVFDGEIVRGLEWDDVRKNGAVVHMETTACPVRDETGRVVAGMSVNVDVTKHHEAQRALRESEEQYRTLVENVNIGVYRNTGGPHGQFLQANPAIVRMFGHETVEEFMTVHVSDLYQDPAERKVFVEEALKRGFVKDQELRLRKKDGTPIWASCTAKIKYDENGDILWFDGVIEDITERKEAEEALRESERRYRALFEGPAEGILVADIETRRFLYANPAACEMLGYPEEELTRLRVDDIHPKEALELVVAEFEAQAAGKKELASEIPCLRKDGTVFYADINTKAVTMDDRPCNIGFFRDTTERREAEEEVRQLTGDLEQRVTERTAEVRESEERYRTLAESAQEFIFTVDSGFRVRYANAYAAKQARRTPDAMTGRTLKDIFPRGTVLALEHHLESVFKSDQPVHVEEALKLTEPAQKPVWLDMRLVPLRDDGGATTGVLVIAHDITRRREAEEALRRSEERLRSIFDNALVGIYRTTPDGRILLANPALVRMLGFESFDELARRNLEEKGYEPECQRREFKERMARDGQVVGLEAAWTRQDGTSVFVRESATAARDDAGNILYYEGTVEDVTARKRAEEALRESEQRYRGIVEDQTEYITRFRPDGTMTFANRACSQLLEEEPDELIGQSFFPYLPEDDAERLKAQLASLDPGRPAATIEHQIVAPDGRVQWQRWTNRAIFDDAGRCTEYQGVGRDVTEQKEAEEAVRESQRALATLMSNLPGMAYRCRNDRNWTMEFVSEGCKPLTGYKAAELAGDSPPHYADLIHPDDRQAVWDDVQAALQKREPFELRYRIRTAGGDEKWVWERGRGIRSEDGELIALEGFITDITEQTLAEEALRESQALLGSAIENLPFDFFAIGADGRYVLQNSFCKERWGNLIGTRPEDASVEEATVEQWRNNNRRAFAGETVQGEVAYTEGGQTRHYHNIIAPIREGDRVQGILGMNIDITERREAEEALRESEERLRNVYDTAPLAFVVWDTDLRITGWNRRAEELFGWTQKEALGRSFFDIIIPEHARSNVHDVVDALLRGELPSANVNENITKDGDIITCEWNNSILRDSNGNAVGAMSLALDITDRKHAEAALRDSEARYRAMFDQAIDSVVLFDPDTGGMVEFNDAAHKNLGYTREEFERLSLADIDVVETPEETRSHIEDVISGRNAVFETKHRRKDGEIRNVEVSSGAVVVRGKQLLLSILRDVTDAVRAREQIDRQAAILANVTDAVAVVRSDRTLAHWNKGAEQMFGYTKAEMLGEAKLSSFLRAGHDAERLTSEILAAVADEGSWTQNRFPCRHKDGRDMWIHVTASFLEFEPDRSPAMLLVAKDVTEEVLLQERLIRAERLATIGTLASGVAHEMNNLLGGLRGLADIAEHDAHMIPRLVDSARVVADRGGAIAARLTSLARANQPGGDRLIDVPDAVRTAVAMADPMFARRAITVEQRYEPTAPSYVGEGKVFQVVLNLLVNACDSIGRDGTVRVSVDQDKEANEHVITVSDSGAGIEPEDIPRLFEPFFTTKREAGPEGEDPSHLGLGLPETRTIVRQYGGDVSVESAPGQGATFVVRLPIRPAPAAEAATGSPAGFMPETHTPILIVDDDELIRFWLSQHLEAQGYPVTAVDNGRDALAACEEKAFPYVFLDLLMPGELDGAATCRELKAACPDAKIIIITAFARDTIPEDCLAAAHAVLTKPFGIGDLAQAFAGENASS